MTRDDVATIPAAAACTATGTIPTTSVQMAALISSTDGGINSVRLSRNNVNAGQLDSIHIASMMDDFGAYHGE
jgi:hypothetical protein